MGSIIEDCVTDGSGGVVDGGSEVVEDVEGSDDATEGTVTVAGGWKTWLLRNYNEIIRKIPRNGKRM